MVSVRKSPNMMSTTGRSPVIAAPIPIPVNPASEIGVSSTRSRPNSSTNPARTLNGVPASATSSPKMQTRLSRRISSASASRTACARVNSRAAASGIHVLGCLLRLGIWRSNGKLDCRFHVRSHLLLDLFEGHRVRDLLLDHPPGEVLERVAFGLPLLLLVLRAVVLPVDVAHVVSVVAICIADQKRRPFALARAFYKALCRGINRAHILPVRAFRMHTERDPAREQVPGGCLGIVRVFVIEVVLTNVEYRQFPQRREVHHFIQNALSQRSLAKKAHRHLPRAQPLR